MPRDIQNGAPAGEPGVVRVDATANDVVVLGSDLGPRRVGNAEGEAEVEARRQRQRLREGGGGAGPHVA